MASSEVPPDDLEGTYLIDAESDVEMGRLLDFDRIMTKSMGGLLSEQDEAEIAQMHAILDIGCGPGGWVCDVARTYPHLQVTGIDTSRRLLQHAREQVAAEGLSNAAFHNMNALKPLQFPDASFDLVNIRHAVGFVPTAYWPHLIKACQRVLRPGGILRVTEGELAMSNMPNVEAVLSAVGLACYRAGRGGSPNGKHLGMITILNSLLKQAELQHIRNKAHVVDYSYGMPAHESILKDNQRTFFLIKPLIKATNVLPEAEYDIIYKKALQEMRHKDFHSVFFMLTCWGRRSS
jgi:ubiquinone/menaquinone biosynthesis C-methylase UbiE